MFVASYSNDRLFSFPTRYRRLRSIAKINACTTVTVTVTGTAGVKESLLGLDSWIAAAEEVSLQTASEGGKRRCRRSVLRQTVPNTGCSDWKGPVADS